VTSSFAAFLVRRLLAAALLVAVVSSSALLITRMAPGDATSELFLSGASKETIAAARARWGLDRPFISQLGTWIVGLAHFDLGRSSSYDRPVAPLVMERAANTAKLAAVALALATIVGLPIGLLTGARPRGWLAAVVEPVSIALVSCPPIVGALVLLLLVVTGWLPVSTTSLIVPALAAALPLAATIERLQSQATRDAMGSPDILAAAARGIPPERLLWVHTARQSLRPVLGVYGIMIGSLFSGSLAVEIVTSWPGLGQLTYQALQNRDLYLVAGCALLGAVFLAIGNLGADLARAAVDPRVR
jgi:peptide/nickel transport system permease protein